MVYLQILGDGRRLFDRDRPLSGQCALLSIVYQLSHGSSCFEINDTLYGLYALCSELTLSAVLIHGEMQIHRLK